MGGQTRPLTKKTAIRLQILVSVAGIPPLAIALAKTDGAAQWVAAALAVVLCITLGVLAYAGARQPRRLS